LHAPTDPSTPCSPFHAPVSPGTPLARGERFGMIAFGSRTELYVPTQDNWQPAVKLGDGVRAGKTIFLRK
jgi:phosphatidylserine decarboxylase